MLSIYVWAILKILSIDVWTPLDAASGSRDVAHRSRWLHSWGFTSNWSNFLSARNTRDLPQALKNKKGTLLWFCQSWIFIRLVGNDIKMGNMVHTFWHCLGFCVTRAPLLYFVRSWVALSLLCESVSQSGMRDTCPDLHFVQYIKAWMSSTDPVSSITNCYHLIVSFTDPVHSFIIS